MQAFGEGKHQKKGDWYTTKSSQHEKCSFTKSQTFSQKNDKFSHFNAYNIYVNKLNPRRPGKNTFYLYTTPSTALIYR